MSNTIVEDLARVDNLNDPPPILSSRGAILGIIATFVVLSCVCAVGRIWIRVMVTHTPGLDDVFVALSMISNIAGAVVICSFAPRVGLGQHFILLGLNGMGDFMRIVYAMNVIYNVSTTLIKLALLFQYIRVLEKGSILYRLTVMMIVVVSVWGITFSILAVVPCVPIDAFWSVSVFDDATRYGYGSRHVDVIADTFLGHSSSNMFLDLVIFAIPIPFWFGPKVERKTRHALLGLFLLGAIVNISSVFRLIALAENRAGTSPTFDPSWYGTAPVVLSAVEVNLASICASLPVFWPIIKNTWDSRKIVVTREVEITSEARDCPMGPGPGDEHDLNPLNMPPESKPWDSMDEARPAAPPRMYITQDQGITLTPQTGASHSYWLGTGTDDIVKSGWV